MTYLIKVEPGANNNKFYQMEIKDSTLYVEFGRVGGTPQKATYHASFYNVKLKEKLKKGYVDMTHLKSVSNSGEVICNAPDLYNLLTSASKQFIDMTYVSGKATPAMIAQAERLISHLVSFSIHNDVERFNTTLSELFTVIPRRMKKVKDHLYNGSFQDILQRERDALDVLKGQIDIEETPESASLLDLYNLEYDYAEDSVGMIKKLLGENSKYFKKAWKVRNLVTEKNFNEYTPFKRDVRLLWHGSRNENWWSITRSGLLIRPSGAVYTGSMFGDGIYFANKASKSLGYTSFSGSYWAKGNSYGLLALYDVHYGNPYVVHEHNSQMSRLDYKTLQSKNQDCTHAKEGVSLRNDEIIVYNSAQCNIKYLVQLEK